MNVTFMAVTVLEMTSGPIHDESEDETLPFSEDEVSTID